MTSHSPLSSTRRSPGWSCIGRTLRVVGGAGAGFFSGRSGYNALPWLSINSFDHLLA